MSSSRYVWSVWQALILVVAAAFAFNGAAQCVWDPQTGQIVETCGKVGIGTATPTAQLHVIDGRDASTAFAGLHSIQVETTANQTDFGALIGAYEVVAAGQTNNGSLLGMSIQAFNSSSGTIAALTGSTIEAGMNPTSNSYTGSLTDVYGQKIYLYKGFGNVTNGYGVWVNDVGAVNGWAFYQTGSDDRNYFAGTIGAGTQSPWGRLHLYGTGQTSNNPELTSTTAAQHGSTLFLQDSGGASGNGGMAAFGAQQGHFAAIKGSIVNGAANTTGDLLFLTRNASTDTALTERMRIFGNGRVSIGTTSDSSRLHVLETNANAWGLNVDLFAAPTVSGVATGYGAVIRADYNVASGVVMTGQVIGTHTEAYNTGAGNVAGTVGQVVYSGTTGTGGATVNTAYGTIIVAGGSGVGTGFGLYVADVGAPAGFSIYQVGTNDVNYFAGKVGIGNSSPAVQLDVVGAGHFTGSLTVDGNIAAKYQDVAEWVPATTDMAPGTVVVLNAAAINEVMPSSHAYDTTVAGVVSAQPGVLLGVAGDSKELIATTGRVKVRVDATHGAIHVGDLLVTSDEPGTAMVSEPLEISGRKFHQPGTILGKALEPLPSGRGEILVLLSLQ